MLESFHPITLADTISKASLMSRSDIKFLMTQEQMLDVLDMCSTSYHVLEIQSSRVANYDSQYFDTPGLQFYHEHHSGRLNRRKIRVRRYPDTSQSFLEVKHRLNKGIMVKSRIEITDTQMPDFINLLSDRAFSTCGPLFPERLVPTLSVSYRRITLVSPSQAERVTLDFDISFQDQGLYENLDGLVIAEIKQDRRTNSVFRQIMKQQYVRSVALSKYCLGMALLHSHIKQNSFKQVLRRVHKLLKHDTTATIQ